MSISVYYYCCDEAYIIENSAFDDFPEDADYDEVAQEIADLRHGLECPERGDPWSGPIVTC